MLNTPIRWKNPLKFRFLDILQLISFYKTSRPGLHAFRAITGAAAIIALFIGLRELPLADVVSLTFGGPIFVTVASIFFLSEKVGIKRWSAVFLGFVGMLLIVQPAFIDLNYYYVTPIVFCIFFACVAFELIKGLLYYRTSPLQ